MENNAVLKYLSVINHFKMVVIYVELNLKSSTGVPERSSHFQT